MDRAVNWFFRGVLILWCLSTASYAVTREKLVYGYPEATNEMVLVSDGVLTNIEDGISNEEVGQITLSNNNPEGFLLSISSLNRGQLLLEDADGQIQGSAAARLNYALSLAVLPSENWGVSTQDQLINLPIAEQPTVRIRFTDEPVRPTIEGVIAIQVSMVAQQAFSGRFTDEISLEISNL